MKKEQVIEILGDNWFQLHQLIKEGLNTDVELLQDTNNNILSNEGKLIRPMICLLIAKLIAEPCEETLKYAAACEILHNATLMHDDVADSSFERRGRPTVNALLGPGAAVLVGDFWLAKSVEIIVNSKHYQRISKVFTQTLSELSEGELLQMEKASEADTDYQTYLRIISCKTATLFKTAAYAGAISVGASPEQEDAAKNFGRNLGIAFQIKDDILDYLGTDHLGKPIGVDLKEKKITLPLLGALKDSDCELQIREKVKKIDTNPEYYEEIRTFVLNSKGIDYAISKLDYYIAEAINSLAIFEDSPSKRALIEIIQYNRCREV